MKRAVVQVNTISVLKVCRNHVGEISQLTKLIPSPLNPNSLPPPPTPPTSPQFLRSQIPTRPESSNNPCVGLYFQRPVEGSNLDTRSISKCHETLMQKLLPQAWSHDPLTTLKLICRLPEEDFYAAAVWLHHNHPKTLACNLLPIAGSFALISDVLEILLRVGLQQQHHNQVDDYPSTWTRRLRNHILQTQIRYGYIPPNPFMSRNSRVKTAKKKASALLKRRKAIAMANKVVERYDHDPDFRFLHDQVSELMAECLKYDIQELYKLKQQQQKQQMGEKEMLELNITDTADFWYPSIAYCYMARPTHLLYDSIASKVFPPSESDAVSKLESESNPKSLLRLRLKKEVLVPLRQAMESRKSPQDDANQWGYAYDSVHDYECPVSKYMRDLNEAIVGKSKSVSELIEPGAVLPHQILRHARKFEKAVGLQWERMVENLHQKQGKLNNCLAVCNVNKIAYFSSNVGPLGLLVSQLNSQDPWKGKVVSYTRNPRLHLIPPGKDLESTCKFMGSWEKKKSRNKDWEKEVDLVKKVFDLILEVAVKENVKPEHMINKVFVFKRQYQHQHLVGSGNRSKLFGDYDEIERRFEAKGYTVPHLMIWNMIDHSSFEPPVCSVEQGVTLLRGFSDNLVKAFLDNDGEIGPEQVMEAAISDPEYQTLAVVD